MARIVSLQPSVAYDDRGLPVVSFLGQEGFLGRPELRTCRIVENGAGELFIEMRGPWAFRGAARLWLPPLVAIVVFIGLGSLLQDVIGLRPYDVMNTIWFDVIRTLLFACALASAFVVVRLDQLPRFGRSAGGPWLALQSFLVSDSTTLYGDGSKEDAQRTRTHVLQAEFGAGAPAFEIVSTRAQQPSVAELHGVLTREFIERRAQQLDRLAALRRDAQGEQNAERPKVI